MSKKLKTYVRIILDKSGSMCSIANQAVLNFNEQVQQMKMNSDTQEIYCSLITFNGEVFEHLWDAPAKDLEEAAEGTYVTGGGTAFYDALGYTINKTKQVASENINPDVDNAYLFYIISDGEENSSTKYTQQSISKLIDSCNEEGNWTFTYMGCSKQYVEKVAKDINIPLANCAVWSNSNNYEAAHTLTAASSKLGGYYTSRSKGTRSMADFHSDTNNLTDYSEGIAGIAATSVTADVLSQNNVVSSLGVQDLAALNQSFSADNARSMSNKRCVSSTCCSKSTKSMSSNKDGVFTKSTRATL